MSQLTQDYWEYIQDVGEEEWTEYMTGAQGVLFVALAEIEIEDAGDNVVFQFQINGVSDDNEYWVFYQTENGGELGNVNFLEVVGVEGDGETIITFVATYEQVEDIAASGAAILGFLAQDEGRAQGAEFIESDPSISVNVDFEDDVFDSQSIKLAPPAQLTTLNVASNSATVSWGAVENASAYKVEYRASGSSNWTEG